MNRRYQKIIFVWILSLFLMFIPTAKAIGFGTDASGPDVFAIQAMLKSTGYLPEDITGYYGAETKAAFTRFQQAYGLTVNGAVDDRSLESILWVYRQLKITKPSSAEPTPIPIPNPAPSPELSPAPEPTPASGPFTSGKEGLSAEEQQMLDLVNQARRGAGLNSLSVDIPLANVARMRSKDMVDNNYFSHQSPTYGSPFEMMQKFGVSYRSAAENIACNQNVSAAHVALMNSPGHRTNLLNPEYTFIGIGIVDGGACGKMFTEDFISR